MIEIFEPSQCLDVDTPKGRGRIWLVTEYGSEMEKVFTVIINETGEFWEFKNNQVKGRPNLTMTGGFKENNESKADEKIIDHKIASEGAVPNKVKEADILHCNFCNKLYDNGVIQRFKSESRLIRGGFLLCITCTLRLKNQIKYSALGEEYNET